MVGLGDNPEWKQVTNNEIFESDIHLSPDGRKVVYTAFKDGSRDIFVNDLDTLEEEQLTQSSDYEMAAQFSPDGKNLLFSKDDYNFGSRIVVFDLAKNMEKEIFKTSLAIKNLHWGSDGDSIVFTSERDGKNTVAIINKKGGEETKLAEQIGDCRYLVWPSLQKILAFVARTDKGDKLVVMDVATRKMTDLQNVESDIISWAER